MARKPLHTDLPLDLVLDLVDDTARAQRALQALQGAREQLAVGLKLARLEHGASAGELSRCTGLSRREVGRLLRAGTMSAF